eukprot:GHVQ01029133.1.p1 GENE.GHVQ01029133.1~~GHVQ01029133.1.p1  ORF type:complete len:181 (-),score=23.95 GHVQ01029133.1:289-831(-)
MDFVQDGDVCMHNTSANSNGSQFMITFRPIPVLYGYSVVFGTVLKGMRIIRMMEDLGTQFGTPRERIRIVNCGLYHGPKDGPPFFSMPEILDRYETDPIKEGEFMKLPEERQQKLIAEQQRQRLSSTVPNTTQKKPSNNIDTGVPQDTAPQESPTAVSDNPVITEPSKVQHRAILMTSLQ